MFQKKNCVIGIVGTYVILILLFFVFKESRRFRFVCRSDRGCVRFCCGGDNATQCDEKFIRANFNESLVPKLDPNTKTSDIKILIGKPKCSMDLVEHSDSAWFFLMVRGKRTSQAIELHQV